MVSLLSQAVTYGLWIAAIAGYWYGGWRPRKAPQKITRGFTTLMSVLIAAYLVVRAAQYWVSQYAVATSSRGPVTGPSYTDVHAVLPGTYVLVAVSIVGALVLVVNLARRARVRWLGRPPWSCWPRCGPSSVRPGPACSTTSARRPARPRSTSPRSRTTSRRHSRRTGSTAT